MQANNLLSSKFGEQMKKSARVALLILHFYTYPCVLGERNESWNAIGKIKNTSCFQCHVGKRVQSAPPPPRGGTAKVVPRCDIFFVLKGRNLDCYRSANVLWRESRRAALYLTHVRST